MGTMTFGGAGGSPGRDTDVDRRPPADRHVPRRGRQPHRHRRRLLGRPVRGDPRRGAAGRRDACWSPPRSRMPMGDGPNDAGPLPPPHHRAAARPACAGSAPTTSTCTRCTSGTARPRSRRRWRRSTSSSSSGKVRYIGASNYAGLAADEGARHGRKARPASGSSASRSTTRCRRATPNTSWCRCASTRASASWSGARSRAACCPASTAAASEPPAGSRRLTDWNEPPVHDQERLYDIIEVLVGIAEQHGVSAAQVALA